ncbi:hypothetical protein TMatcc_009571 [Talaromyces marneffei ATCC 18224]
MMASAFLPIRVSSSFSSRAVVSCSCCSCSSRRTLMRASCNRSMEFQSSSGDGGGLEVLTYPSMYLIRLAFFHSCKEIGVLPEWLAEVNRLWFCTTFGLLTHSFFTFLAVLLLNLLSATAAKCAAFNESNNSFCSCTNRDLWALCRSSSSLNFASSIVRFIAASSNTGTSTCKAPWACASSECSVSTVLTGFVSTITVFAPPPSFLFKLICAFGGRLTADGVRRFRNGRPIALIKLNRFRSDNLSALALVLVEAEEPGE